jgi:CheY-like chemotaxis protein
MTCAVMDRDQREAATPLPSLVIDDDDIFVGRTAPAPRVLVVDGDAAVAQSLALMFTDLGFVVETAGLGAEGLSLALTRPYSLLVLGADLPDMSGLEALSRLRQAEVGVTVVFASLTAPARLHLSDGA